MIILNGKNLGERQQQLNKIVNDAAEDKTDFNVIKAQDEKSDIDKLFKIDLAAKYKNLEYILEILKCGDHLYISRALNKCSWLYDDDFKHIVNDDYLSKNLFPLMSMKMRHKVLTTIATNLKNGDTRAINFFTYCMNIKLYNIALKFVIRAPIYFKLDLIVKKEKAFELITEKEGDYLKHFIGESFELAEAYVKSFDSLREKANAIYLLRYMYLMSNEKYLDILETCTVSVHIFGRRLSKHIIKNYKSRVMKKPLLYTNVLNKDIFKRNCTNEEVKILCIALLPETPTSFFDSNYCSTYKFILDLIPEGAKFRYIKKIFSEKYPNELFETRYEFYTNKNCFEIMTPYQKEKWALNNLESQTNDIPGTNYLWYRFVNFDKGFNQLKKDMMKITERTKRCQMLIALLDSVKNEEDLTKLLNYFSERHRNEVSHVYDGFLGKLTTDHKVWHFGEDCWKALEKIFYNIGVFDTLKHCDSNYRVLALMYYVVNEKPVPEVLNKCIELKAVSVYTIGNNIRNLKHETEMMFQYILRYYTERIKAISSIPCDNNTNFKLRRYVSSTLDIAQICNKTKDDLPEIVLSHIKLDWAEFKHHDLLAGPKLSSNDIRHYLKKDATLVVTQFPQIKGYCESNRENINWLLQKLKVYFSHDLSDKYLTLLGECLSGESLHHVTVEIAVRGILILADWTRKIEFLEKYTPTDKAINRATMSTITLDIQKAICRQMLCSRPQLPLAKVFQYVIGDYVKYCLVLFHSFLVNLPQPQCLEFVQKMINSPVSIQKHGLRLAFECFEPEKLQGIILDAWHKTKNVSLRSVLYQQLSVKVSGENGDTQSKLFDVLITLTSDLNEYDEEKALSVIDTIQLPDHLVGRYLEAAWNTVSKFSENPQNLKYMVMIIKRIDNKLYLVPENCVDKIINDHVHFMLDEERIILNNKNKPGFDDLLNSKWTLTVSSIAHMINDKKFEKNVQLAKHIIKKCIEMWNELKETDGKYYYVVRQFLKGFITDLNTDSILNNYNEKCYSNFVILIQTIEIDLKKDLPEKEIYHLVWVIQSSVVTIKIVMGLKLCTETLKLDDIIEPGMKLGKDFGILIKTKVEEGTFYHIFCEQMQNIVTTMVQNFRNHFRRWDLFSATDALILFCSGLLEHEIFEAYVIALNILPSEYDGEFMNTYLSAIKRIQAFQNTEIQFYVYEKFVNTDFKKRDYIE